MKKCDCYIEVNSFNPDPYSSLIITQSRCDGTKERDECTCGGDPAKCDFYPEKREAAKKEEIKVTTIYYAHHQWKYGTKIEEYELDIIKKNFPNAVIFNPATDLEFKDCGNEEIIMDECLSKMMKSDIVIFSCMDGMIGIGVYKEIEMAKAAGKLVLCISQNILRTEFIICESPEFNSDRLYARVGVPMFD